MYRQGGILIVEADLPTEGDPHEVEREGGRIILAFGEATGHAHAIETPSVRLMNAAQQRYIVADTPFEITHEEHATVQVPAGTFRVIRQREYVPDSHRIIKD